MSKKKIPTHKSTQSIISLLGKELFYSIADDDDSIKSRGKLAALIEESLQGMEKEPSESGHYGRAGFYT